MVDKTNRTASLLQPMLLSEPIVGLFPCGMETANALLIEWGLKLGPVHRPFTQQGWVLMEQQQPIAVAVSASIVSATAAEYTRGEVVELARRRAAPAQAWASRIMLRLWREVCAPLWPHWTVKAAISYSHNAQHKGDLYRFDGWTKDSDNCGSGGGGAWSRKRYATDAVHGRKTRWVWRYES